MNRYLRIKKTTVIHFLAVFLSVFSGVYAHAVYEDPRLGMCTRILDKARKILGVTPPLDFRIAGIERYVLDKNDVRAIQAIIPKNNITLLTKSLAEPILKASHENKKLVFRGMRLSPQSLSLILTGGMHPQSAQYGEIYTAINSEEAVRYTLPVHPDSKAGILMVVFAIDPSEIEGSWPPIGYFITERTIPSEKIISIWVYNKSEPDITKRFVQFLN